MKVLTPQQPVTAKGDLPSRDLVEIIQRIVKAVGAVSGGGVPDGDKGDVTVSGATWTIDAGAVTLAKMADMATSSLIYRKTAGAGTPEVQTLATLKTDLGLTGTNSGDQTITLTGAITGTGTGSFATALGSFTKAQLSGAVSDGDVLFVGDVTSNATHTGDVTGATALTIAAGAVTFAKMQNVAANSVPARAASTSGDLSEVALAASQLLGRGSTGDVTAITLGTNLSMSGTTLNAASGGSATVYYGHLQADYTLTSTTAAQKLFNWSTNGALTLATGIWRFKAMIYLTGMSATSGNGAFGLLGAGTATLARILYQPKGVDNTTPLAAAARGGSASVTALGAASMVTAATGTGLLAEIDGIFDVTAAGTIIPSISLVTAAAAVVKAGSFFTCERIGDTATAVSSGWS